jgi:23S rRNA maturation mini-RNase III
MPAQLYVRRYYFYPPTRVTQYYENTIAKVRAEAQVRLQHFGRRHTAVAAHLLGL